MRTISARDLRNHGGDVLRRVASGETFIVTCDDEALAELRPLKRTLPAGALLARWRHLPALDPAHLRADIDEVLERTL